tara:strand:- start:160605 stop:161636 length:1032 start_codon:yes stop_codon:yes gene_type:complete
MVNNEKKEAYILKGTIALCFVILTAFCFVLFWPQKNLHDSAQLKIRSGIPLAKLAQQMKNDNLISNENTFIWTVQLLGKSRIIPAGNFTLSSASNNYIIISQLINESPELKKITFLEGWSTNQFINHIANTLGFEKKEIRSLTDNIDLLKKYNINYNSIEGYMYPDTYFISSGATPKNILRLLLDQGQKFWTKTREERADSLGFTKHQIITLASIIEGEAIYDNERPIISGVYHNRLKINMKLQADPTIQYIINDGPRRLLNRDLKIKSQYNTYLYQGLPPGPINSPGEKSLLAALYPQQNDYLFFVAKGDGYHTFTKTEKEHMREKKKFQKIRKALKRNRKQ